jgi:hypothetical protein
MMARAGYKEGRDSKSARNSIRILLHSPEYVYYIALYVLKFFNELFLESNSLIWDYINQIMNVFSGNVRDQPFNEFPRMIFRIVTLSQVTNLFNT